jgi:large subunit ribosomal protein L25
VECLPSFIPPHVDVNVEHLKVGDSLRLDEVVLDQHLTIHGDTHNVICSVKGKLVEEETPEAAAAAAEGAAAPAAEGAAAPAAPAPAAPAPAARGKK